MRMKKPAVALATAALMTLAACGGGSGGGGTGGNDAGENPSYQPGGDAGSGKNPDLEGPVPVPEDAQDGGTMTVLTNQVPSTLDPTRAYYTDSTAILSGLVTRSLTQYVYDPESEDMVLVPDLATGLGKANEDNTEWTFTLKEGIKYEDGTDVKPEDIAYAIARSFAIEELPEGPTYQLQFFLNGDTYKGPFKDGSAYKGVEVNGQDITIKMAQPFADMPYYASFPLFTPIPEAKDDPTNYGNHPLATGPYMFENYRPGTSLTLVKNPNWDADSDPGRIQAVDTWEFQFGEETAKLENVIINDQGDAQTTLTYDNVTPPGYRQIQSDKSRLVTGTSPCTYMWFIDMRKITDVNVRKALGYAFPYEDYWPAIGEIVGLTRVPGTATLPPGTAGRVEFDALGIGGKDTDTAKARELLKQAGAEGFEIKFLYSTDDQLSVAGKDQIVRGLEAAGFKATPIATTQDKAREAVSDYDSPINIRSSGWCSDWPTGGSWFPAQWDPDLVGLEGMPNPTNITSPELNKRIDDVLAADPSEAAALWGELDEWMSTELYPRVNLGYSGTAMIHGSKIGGMENDSTRGMPTFTQMYITE